MFLFSIVFQSILQPSKVVLSTTVAKDNAEAYSKGLATIKAQQGDLLWVPIVIQSVAIENLVKDFSHSKDSAQGTVVETPVIAVDENWTYRTIIEKKDKALFDAMLPYMDEHVKQYISDRVTF